MQRFTLSNIRARLLQSQALALLSLFGVITGLATGLVMAWFVFSIDIVTGLLDEGETTGFRGLNAIWRFSLPLIGAVILLVLFKLTHQKYHDVGISHVIDRLQRGRGKIPTGNTLFQFFAALIALGAGYSVGKEGPAVHIGSGIASKLGRSFYQTPSQLRLLTGCGTAAAISAAFNTPLAGVLFAMEVVLMEYSLNGFIPIIAAAVTAAVFTHYITGDHPALLEISIPTGSSIDIIWLLVLGIATGLGAALLHQVIRYFLTLNVVKVHKRFLMAGLISGFCGLLAPASLGIGFDTLPSVLTGDMALWVLAMLVVAKVVATGSAIGLGIPAGIVGPAMVMGLFLGALVGRLLPSQTPIELFAVLGMAGLMSGLLHAPLAAITAVIETSVDASLMFPAMIVVVISNLTCQVLFQQPSVFRTMLSSRGLNISTHPLRNALASRYLTEIATIQFNVITIDMDDESIEQLVTLRQKLFVFRTNTQASYILTHHFLTQRIEAWQRLKESEQQSLYGFLKLGLPERSRITVLSEDTSLLEGIRIFQGEDVAAIQVPLDAFRISLVTRQKLTSVLTSEGELQ
ncbi:chloride channel protein [Reinekea marina]|uniref:Chloride channel protein n=1 Tax=Reinekea marina TaxID=1310421 RepID=A0ABV7WW40_9GAMM|nr:chloride channel protein [Reinekea marina]MDN3647963.1 chloride channel protein [Reinekea marina]